MSAAPADRVQIEPLGTHHDRAAFSCGAPELDRYIREQAGQDARRHVAAPFVLVDLGTGAVAGYYTLSALSIHLSALPRDIARKLPHYPDVPATLLGRLAIDAQFRGRGYGELLLMDALRRSLVQADEIASYAVVVDARDDTAREFYEHFDFRPLPSHPNRLLLSMKTIAILF